MSTDHPEIDRTLLTTYIEDHVAGATGVISRLERLSRVEELGVMREPLGRLAAELREERAAHLATARALELSLSRVKRVGALVGERVARLKPNGRVAGRSPLSLVLELEVVRSGLEGKRMGWLTLREHADALGLDEARIEHFITRSRDQADRIEGLAATARERAFAPHLGTTSADRD
ncbi:hypothetical protein [Cellulomonas shaoxiangyii]|uniref:DUF892 family protein n=1 Tax=Cellulomonas shaoxiangyii TaxID=2566013 RepID=A0A4P7SI97_9CELL|nr:hypothetical protein [Cellulomonas shaoxiangyii]QCB93750.1 hypothetical protein E5225_09440 [Cellulomonas shaoxiangyii]TGY81646.1 hypothetical protein E5226_13970 [Cellulomonas shaoxiangyii]